MSQSTDAAIVTLRSRVAQAESRSEDLVVPTVRVALDLRQVREGGHQLAVRQGENQWRFFAARVE